VKPLTSTDLIYATLKSMPRPASSNDIYLRVVKEGAYANTDPRAARARISARLAELRTKGKVISTMVESKGIMVWDLPGAKKNKAVLEAKEAIQSIQPAKDQQPTRQSHTEILANALEDIATAILKASAELKKYK
jgi:hypothetical protein